MQRPISPGHEAVTGPADRALAGLRALELPAGIAGQYCAKVLADRGAEVLKIEPPGGDPLRAAGPFPRDRPDREASGLFAYLNANKRGITLDLASRAGRRIARALAARTDIVVEELGAGVLEALGLAYDVLRRANPRLVLTRLSAFGQTGPLHVWSGSDLLTYAMGGAMSSTGLPEREPLKLGDNLVLFQAGLLAAAATLAAWTAAERDGEGDQVDVSLYESQAGSGDRRLPNLLGYAYSGENAYREGGGFTILPSGVFACADGYLTIIVNNKWWGHFAGLLGHPELADDPRFRGTDWLHNPDRKLEIDQLWYEWLGRTGKRAAMERIQAHHLPGTMVSTPADVLEDPHFRARGFWQPLEVPGFGLAQAPGAPFRMPESPWSVDRPAPRPGEHTRAVLCGALGYSRAEVARLREQGAI